MNQLRLLDTRLRGDGQHHGRDLVHRRDVQNSFVVCRYLRLTFENQKNDWRRRGEAFIPSGERVGQRRLDNTWTNDATNDTCLGGDELFAKRLRVGVNIRPTPPGGTLHAESGEARAGPNFSFSSYCQTESVRIVGVAVLLVQPFAREVAKARQHHRVARFLTYPLRQFRAVLDLLFSVEFHAG